MSENRQPERKDPEMVLPLTVFQEVIRAPHVVLVLPYESAEGWFADYKRIIKIAGIDDDLYELYTAGMRGKPFYGHVFYDILQIRECTVRDVTPREWYYNLGPEDPRTWMQVKRKGPGSPVRVYHMKKVSYNLREFNKNYRRGLK